MNIPLMFKRYHELTDCSIADRDEQVTIVRELRLKEGLTLEAIGAGLGMTKQGVKKILDSERSFTLSSPVSKIIKKSSGGKKK